MRDSLKAIFILSAGILLSAFPYLPVQADPTTQAIEGLLRKKANASGGGVDKTNLVAWFDMSISGTKDLSNKHNPGTHDLTEGTGNAPTYTADYVVANDDSTTPTYLLSPGGLFTGSPAAFNPDGNTDSTLVIAFRVTNGGHGDYPLWCSGNQCYVRFMSTGAGPYGVIGNVANTNAGYGTLSTGTDYIVAVVHNSTADTTTIWVDGTEYNTSAAGTWSAPTIEAKMPKRNTGVAEMRIYWLGLWNEALDATALNSAQLTSTATEYTDL